MILVMIPIYTKHFEKDVKKAIKRGKNIDKLKTIITKLVNNETLAKTYQDHPLIGNYRGRRECHIESDWLLIYKLIPEDDVIIFERTGTHSDLFRELYHANREKYLFRHQFKNI